MEVSCSVLICQGRHESFVVKRPVAACNSFNWSSWFRAAAPTSTDHAAGTALYLTTPKTGYLDGRFVYSTRIWKR